MYQDAVWRYSKTLASGGFELLVFQNVHLPNDILLIMNTNSCVILNFEITVICTIVSCSFVAIFCFVVRKKCNYLYCICCDHYCRWLLIYGSLSLTTFLIYRNVYKEKNKMGSHFVFAYFVFGCVFLFDVISSIYYVVITM